MKTLLLLLFLTASLTRSSQGFDEFDGFHKVGVQDKYPKPKRIKIEEQKDKCGFDGIVGAKLEWPEEKSRATALLPSPPPEQLSPDDFLSQVQIQEIYDLLYQQMLDNDNNSETLERLFKEVPDEKTKEYMRQKRKDLEEVLEYTSSIFMKIQNIDDESKDIQCQNMDLCLIPLEIFKNYAKTLETLDLSNREGDETTPNQISYLPLSLIRLENLKYLRLDGNPVTSHLIVGRSLEYLSLKNCELTELNLQKTMNSLKKIDFSDSLGNEYLDSIQEIDLAGNEIKTVVSKDGEFLRWFQNLLDIKTLTLIDLTNNKLNELSKKKLTFFQQNNNNPLKINF